MSTHCRNFVSWIVDSKISVSFGGAYRQGWMWVAMVCECVFSILNILKIGVSLPFTPRNTQPHLPTPPLPSSSGKRMHIPYTRSPRSFIIFSSVLCLITLESHLGILQYVNTLESHLGILQYVSTLESHLCILQHGSTLESHFCIRTTCQHIRVASLHPTTCQHIIVQNS